MKAATRKLIRDYLIIIFGPALLVLLLKLLIIEGGR